MKVICGDCVEKMSEMDADSIQLVVTSPPYDQIKDYKGFVFNFEDTARQMFRVLRYGGVACWIVGDQVIDGSETTTSSEQKIFFKKECGFKIHDTMIYEKHSFSHPERVRYHSIFEYIFVLSKGTPSIFNPIKDKPNATAGQRSLGVSTFARPDGSRHIRATQGTISNEFGMRGNIWRGLTRGQEEVCEHKPHPAMMPKWLARDLIISWSNEGDTVLDPFAGSFTTCIEAEQIGRKAIGIDISEEYCELGRNAIIKPQQFEFLENGAQQ